MIQAMRGGKSLDVTVHTRCLGWPTVRKPPFVLIIGRWATVHGLETMFGISYSHNVDIPTRNIFSAQFV